MLESAKFKYDYESMRKCLFQSFACVNGKKKSCHTNGQNIDTATKIILITFRNSCRSQFDRMLKISIKYYNLACRTSRQILRIANKEFRLSMPIYTKFDYFQSIRWLKSIILCRIRCACHKRCG